MITDTLAAKAAEAWLLSIAGVGEAEFDAGQPLSDAQKPSPFRPTMEYDRKRSDNERWPPDFEAAVAGDSSKSGGIFWQTAMAGPVFNDFDQLVEAQARAGGGLPNPQRPRLETAFVGIEPQQLGLAAGGANRRRWLFQVTAVAEADGHEDPFTVTPLATPAAGNRITVSPADYATLTPGEPVTVSNQDGLAFAPVLRTDTTVHVVLGDNKMIGFAASYADAIATVPSYLSLTGAPTEETRITVKNFRGAQYMCLALLEPVIRRFTAGAALVDNADGRLYVRKRTHVGPALTIESEYRIPATAHLQAFAA